MPQARHYVHRGSVSGQDFSVQAGPRNPEAGRVRLRRQNIAAADLDRSHPSRTRRFLSENGPGRAVRCSPGLRRLLSRVLPHWVLEVGLPLQLGKPISRH